MEFWCLDLNIFAVGALLEEVFDIFFGYEDRTFVLLFILLDFGTFKISALLIGSASDSFRFFLAWPETR